MTDKEKIAEINKNHWLVERYPFLLPMYAYTDEVVSDYDYTYTVLDEMPRGWKIAFGEMFCEELRDELLKYKFLEEYRVIQVKEKFGQLRWYDNGSPVGSKIEDIIDKYSVLSENICICCGKPDVPMCGDYWISPFCKECYLKDDYNTEEEWEKYNSERDSRMSDYRRYRTSEGAEPGKMRDVEIDVSETAEKIRINYRRRTQLAKSTAPTLKGRGLDKDFH